MSEPRLLEIRYYGPVIFSTTLTYNKGTPMILYREERRDDKSVRELQLEVNEYLFHKYNLRNYGVQYDRVQDKHLP